MNTATLLCLTGALLVSPSCISNHQFVERGDGPPDWQQLEAARAALPEDEDPEDLVDLTWLPGVVLQLERYAPSEPTMLAGNTLTDAEGYGPLVMFGSHDTWSFDERGELYEQRDRDHALWGLWESDTTRVKVPTGWRVDSNPKLLFGLLRWPSSHYVTE